MANKVLPIKQFQEDWKSLSAFDSCLQPSQTETLLLISTLS